MDPAIVPFVVQEGHGVPWPLKSAKATRSDRPGKGSPFGNGLRASDRVPRCAGGRPAYGQRGRVLTNLPFPAR